MRFRRWPRVSAFEDTPRKRAALRRSQRHQRDRHPLLAAIIGNAQPSADTEMARRAEQMVSHPAAGPIGAGADVAPSEEAARRPPPLVTDQDP